MVSHNTWKRHHGVLKEPPQRRVFANQRDDGISKRGVMAADRRADHQRRQIAVEAVFNVLIRENSSIAPVLRQQLPEECLEFS